MPVLEMDVISREKTLARLAAALHAQLSGRSDGIPRGELFRMVKDSEGCYDDDLVLALSRLDVIEADNGVVRLAA